MNDDTDRIEGLDRLPRAQAPARDLWPGVSARLTPRRRHRYRYAQLAVAASVVAGFAAVFALSLTHERVPGSGAAAPPARTTLALTDDSRAIVEANLSIVEHAGRELRQALEQTPHSSRLRDLLARAENRERALRALL